MKCAHAKRWLNLYVDGRLSLPRYTRLERHLRTCDPCRQELAFLETLRASVADADVGPIPELNGEEMTASIMSRVAAYEVEKSAAEARTGKRVRARRVASVSVAAKRRAALRPRASAGAHYGARPSAPAIGLVWLDWARQSAAWMAWRRWRTAQPSWRWSSATLAIVLLALAVFVWPAPFGQGAALALLGQLEPTHLLGAAEQWLLTPGPDAIIWGAWVAGAVVALVAVAWFARADASAEWRRALVARLPQFW